MDFWENAYCRIFQARCLPQMNTESRLNIILLSMYTVHLLELQMIQHLGSAGKAVSWPEGLANLSTVVYDPASFSERRRPIVTAMGRATCSAPVKSYPVHYASLNPQQRWVWSATPDWIAVAEVPVWSPLLARHRGALTERTERKEVAISYTTAAIFLTCTLGRETWQKRCIIQWWKHEGNRVS